MLRPSDILVTEADRFYFMKAIVAVAKLGGVDPSELVFFQAAMESLALSATAQAELVQLLTTEQLVSLEIQLQSKRQALYLLREAVQLCCVDGRYSPAERELISVIAAKAGVSSSSLVAIEGWVQEGLNWSSRGDALLELEG